MRQDCPERMPGGPVEGEVFDLDRLLDEYYEARGWDSDGIPRLDKLRELGIDTYR